MTSPMLPWPVHPAANLLPLLGDDELSDLADDIGRHGLIEPVVLTESGELLDGRNRALACQLAGVEITTRTYHGADEIGYVLSLNLHRRHLTDGQKAAVSHDALPLIEAEARRRSQANLTQNSECANWRTRDGDKPQRSTEVAAALTGTSGRSVARFKRISEHAPDLAEAVRSGDTSLHAAETELKARLEPQRDEPSRDDFEAWSAEERDLRSRYGNPYKIGRDGNRAEVIARYQDEHLPSRPDLTARLSELHGKVLGCWCHPEPCHGDVLAAEAGR